MKHYLRGPLVPLAFVTMLASVMPSRAQTMQIDGKFDVGGRSIRLMCQGTSEPSMPEWARRRWRTRHGRRLPQK